MSTPHATPASPQRSTCPCLWTQVWLHLGLCWWFGFLLAVWGFCRRFGELFSVLLTLLDGLTFQPLLFGNLASLLAKQALRLLRCRLFLLILRPCHMLHLRPTLLSRPLRRRQVRLSKSPFQTMLSISYFACLPSSQESSHINPGVLPANVTFSSILCAAYGNCCLGYAPLANNAMPPAGTVVMARTCDGSQYQKFRLVSQGE